MSRPIAHYRRLPRAAQARAAFWMAQVVCDIPDPLENDAQCRRYCHDDLAALPHGELLREQLRVRLRFAVDPAAPPWLVDRERAVGIEILARTTGPTRESHP